MDAIIATNLVKRFRIPHERRDTFFSLIKGLFKTNRYEILYGLKDINLTIEKGETFGVIGENGSGKSTLLKVIANILKPTSGTIHVNGTITPFLELGIGINGEFSAVDNIRLYAAIMGIPNNEIDEKIEKILSFAGLEKFRDTKVNNYSSGMYSRLAFSTAIETNPDILLLDEVLAVGDLGFQKKCIEVMRQFKNEGVTILFVSHDLSSIRNFCDRTLLLSHGEQIALGDTNDVVDRYLYQKPITT